MKIFNDGSLCNENTAELAAEKQHKWTSDSSIWLDLNSWKFFTKVQKYNLSKNYFYVKLKIDENFSKFNDTF